MAPHTLPTTVETAWITGCCSRRQNPSHHPPAGKETTLVEHLLCAGHTHSSQQSYGVGTIITPIVHMGKLRPARLRDTASQSVAKLGCGLGHVDPAGLLLLLLLPSRAHKHSHAHNHWWSGDWRSPEGGSWMTGASRWPHRLCLFQIRKSNT